ncbi:transcription-repair coupling factor [Arthrospira platensis NCB002]|uniref:Transcription-repair-coupling factor n=1 Tax=Limnospira platensis NIES-46 TaxID=1236695 RepID=A0A5M3T7C5_LIMPL|nr:transcription-repair coupling factor [Arthrospira platensis]MDF2212219.1 transcription-repair coupling factor [Arthrospira platensis NCB002]BAI92237.1 transcriptional-repair coupling factor [Arthrospira platensis NIES-39]BDT14542.1 transcriptional-repair coupling factor [Arthrospira platensis NIES-39]GCE93800.1 transcriptional-repair coupling factor [Arthrospira platensis NIES-46]
MTFSAVVRALGRSPLMAELITKLNQQQALHLNGLPRVPKGLVASALAQEAGLNLLVVTATLEEAGRWSAQLEVMGWQTVHFYPTSEASPYEPSYSEEMVWGQMQVLADLVTRNGGKADRVAVVATERSLQPHLPPVSDFQSYCLPLKLGMTCAGKTIDQKLAQLGYQRVTVVETEGQWSRRGDIVDVFPVASELPVRLEWFGDELERMRELDPVTQRSLDRVDQLILTPTHFSPIIEGNLSLSTETLETLKSEDISDSKTGLSHLLGLAYQKPASLIDYLPELTLAVIDEPDQCAGHGDRWFEHIDEQWQNEQGKLVTAEGISLEIPAIHQCFQESLAAVEHRFDRLYLSELSDYKSSLISPSTASINLASRPVPVTPHQFGKIAEMIREQRDRQFNVFLISAQPSRSVALLSEHDCPSKFIPNPRDYPAIDSLIRNTPIALKYTGLAELEGFILPTFRLVIVTDREFYGQHALATSGYIRKRRRAASKQVDPNRLQPGDYVVHRQHGIGKFVKLESLTISQEIRDYLVLQYADGTLRVAADQVGTLSRLRRSESKVPQLNKLTGKAWEKNREKVRKSVKKLAVDLLKLYAERSQKTGFSYPHDTPWQQEMEDSFPYKPTPDQLKCSQDVKRDMESDRPMDRLVCGDVGFGKTEVAIRAIFKAVTGGKQVAFLAPTTILTQQHYHTLKERFAPYPIEIGLLNRFRSASEKKLIQQKLITGEIDIIVGTHSVLSKHIKFRDLGLLVVDEEQRFGVNQKEKIKALKTHVDVLTLTATPIPRTLYMALSGIREMSLITTPPPSRRPIKTHLGPLNQETIRAAICQELDRGGQVFYVVPRIEGIEEKSAAIREMVPSARLAIAHGQMEAGELESIMLTFSAGEADILVCTTIIESGLDIPRVNTILVEDAHKFGLGQLYQLRGRVGRAGAQAHAWLFYPIKGDGQAALTEDAVKRLRAIKEFTQLGSGYQLAMRDLEIRGAGDILGAQQSGQMNAIGFDLYTEMLQEAIQEVRGQEIPQVDDTQVDLILTAFIPSDYITDLDQKMSAYRAVASCQDSEELSRIEEDWSDRYGTIPAPAQQLLRVMELKQIAKKLGFARIKPDDSKQNIILETPMEEPAWNLLKQNLPEHLQPRFIYGRKQVKIRGLGALHPSKQLDCLIQWLQIMQEGLQS